MQYWLCEHTGVIRRRNNQSFPRYLRWDLNRLHEKISKTGLDAIGENLVSVYSLLYGYIIRSLNNHYCVMLVCVQDIVTVLKPTLTEKFTFRITEMQDTGNRVDTPTHTRNGKSFKKCTVDCLSNDSRI